MVKQFVVDFDDLCDNVADNSYEQLTALKERVPTLKVTLFTIPKRVSIATIERFKQLDWVALAPHGWRHTRGECLAWNVDEAVDKITMAAQMGIDAPVFRAPAWLLDEDVYEACAQLGYVVAAHAQTHVPHDKVRHYIYNSRTGKKAGVRACHGHLTPVSGNFINDMVEDGRLDLPADATYLYPWEAAVIVAPTTVMEEVK